MNRRILAALAVFGTACVAFAEKDLRAEWEGGKRAETLEWFRKEMFGYSPPRPSDETFDDTGVSFGKGQFKIRIHHKLPKGACAENPAPVFVLIDHYNGAERKDGLWHRPGTPTNSIVSHGYAYVNFNVNDVAPNCYDKRWRSKVHEFYGADKPDSWGTISAWAWGVSRVMDWIETRPELDATRVAVIGHSRGGKTALWAAAQDERIAMAIPNGSGTGGARLMAMKMPKAEALDWMLHHSIKFWYCQNAQQFAGGREYALPHDADDLIRLVCPRLVYVGSGSEDEWAGPEGEFEAARRASGLWRAYGKKGLSLAAFPEPGTWANEGSVGYMLHKGPHQLTAWNWERVLDFADRHMKKNGEVGPLGNADDQFRLFWDGDDINYEQIRDIGFNTMNYIDLLKDETHAKIAADGLGCVRSVIAISWNSDLRKAYPRYNRDGTKDIRTLDPTEPGFMKKSREMLRKVFSVAATKTNCIGVMVASELGCHTRPSFSERHLAAYRAYAGREVPAEATGRACPSWKTRKDLPADRLIDDDYPLYSFYRWFWSVDDGFEPYYDMAVEEAEKAFGRDIFSMVDPVIRHPPVWGFGWKVGYASDWQPAQPIPFQQSYIVSKEKAQARRVNGRQVLTMVQGIMNRGCVAPRDKPLPPNAPEWAKTINTNKTHIAPARDMMREAFWSAFSRQLDGICSYGTYCLFPSQDPATVPMMQEIFHRVAIPLGPILRHAAERAPEVAVLETLPSTLLSGKAPYNWKIGFDTMDVGIVAVGANLNPYTLFDDEILRDGIPESVKVILAPEAQILTKRVAAKLREFQARGGKILARADLAPGLKGDGELPRTRFNERPGQLYDIQAGGNDNFDGQLFDDDLRAAIRGLKAAVDPYVRPYADTDNVYLNATAREASPAGDLVVVYSTKRGFGDYLGAWKKNLDRGLPNAGKVTVGRTAGAVYDLVRHKAVPFAVKDGRTVLDVSYETTEGDVFLVTAKPLQPLTATAAKTPEGLRVLVRSAEGEDVMRPIAVTVGTAKPFYGIVHKGQFEHTFDVPDGTAVAVTDLATDARRTL